RGCGWSADPVRLLRRADVRAQPGRERRGVVLRVRAGAGENAVILLSLDPSSTRIGYAATTGLPPRNVRAAGVIRPDHPSWSSELRAREMAACAVEVARECKADRVLIERPAPQSPNPRNRGQA